MAVLRFLCFCLCVLVNNAQSQSSMAKKILVILTSADKMGDTEKPIGWYLPELAHPYKALVDAGFIIESVSPKGGKAPVDPGSVEDYKDDPICQWFQKDAKAQALVDNTKTPSQIDPSDYSAVFYPGGHGPMFDLANDDVIANITAEVFNNGGVVAAVCHGPAGLVPVQINGQPIVKGRKITAFSNAEEDAIQLSSSMPFMLETKLKEQGGQFTAAPLWEKHVVIDGCLVTGQNPNSAQGVGNAIIDLLS